MNSEACNGDAEEELEGVKAEAGNHNKSTNREFLKINDTEGR
jgi:hypothetical protein